MPWLHQTQTTNEVDDRIVKPSDDNAAAVYGSGQARETTSQRTWKFNVRVIILGR